METTPSSSQQRIIFKTSDGKLVQAAKDFGKISLMLSDMMQIQWDELSQNSIELSQIHSLVLEQINVFVDKLLNDEKLKVEVPYGQYDDAVWNGFVTKHYDQFKEWCTDFSINLLKHMANAGYFLQMKFIVHVTLMVLAERIKDKPLSEMRELLNESDEMDEEMKTQLGKALSTYPDL